MRTQRAPPAEAAPADNNGGGGYDTPDGDFAALEQFLACEGEAIVASTEGVDAAWGHWRATHQRLGDAYAALDEVLSDDALWLGGADSAAAHVQLMARVQALGALVGTLRLQQDVLLAVKYAHDDNVTQLVAAATTSFLARRPALEPVRDVRAQGAARRPREGALDLATGLGDGGHDEVRPGVNRLHASPMEHLAPSSPLTPAPRGPAPRAHASRARRGGRTTVVRDDLPHPAPPATGERS